MGSRGKRSRTSERNRNDKDKYNGHFGKDGTAQGVADYLGVSIEEAQEFINTMWAFTGDYFSEIRKLQNDPTAEISLPDDLYRKRMIEKGENLEKYINLAPKWNGGTTYRGINISSDDLKKYKIGQTLDVNRGTSSWTSDIEIGKKFSKGTDGDGTGERVVFISSTQQGGTSIKHLSQYGHENEVAVSRNSKYVITDINKKKDGIIYIDVKER